MAMSNRRTKSPSPTSPGAQAFSLPFPTILGGDATGTIEGLADSVGWFDVGARVIAHFAQRGKGPPADFAVVPIEGVARLPETLSFEQAAALPQVGLTGRQVVDTIDPAPGERVLLARLSGLPTSAACNCSKSRASPMPGPFGLPDKGGAAEHFGNDVRSVCADNGSSHS